MEDVAQGNLNEYVRELPSIIEKAKTLIVVDEVSARIAGALVDQWRARKKAFLEWINPHIDRANLAHKALTQDRAKIVNGYDEVIETVGSQVITWQDEEKRKREEAEARIQAEMKAREEEAQLAVAEQLEKAGDHEMAEAVISQPAQPARVILPPVVKIIGDRKTFDFELTNEKALPREYLQPDLVKIRRMVVAMGYECTIPGIRVFERKGLSGK